ncbi:hypothetical protein [Methanoregula sp.]|uniref:hypothetical protein n=1 Tax=Methanoregula sp. TaxID=2052170 RepID=UPI003C73EABB
MDQNPDWGVQENLALLIHSEISEVLGSLGQVLLVKCTQVTPTCHQILWYERGTLINAKNYVISKEQLDLSQEHFLK